MILLAAKQEAFEESIKLKNQFRNLDEDEAEFLDSVLESTRAKEDAVKKETTEQLDLFRRQQEEADKALLDATGDEKEIEETAVSPTTGESQWAVNARKRKRLKEKEVLKGVKLRKSSTHEGVTRRESISDTGGPTPHTNTEHLGAATQKVEDCQKEEPPSPVEAKPTETSTLEKGTKPAQAPAGLGLAGYSSDED